MDLLQKILGNIYLENNIDLISISRSDFKEYKNELKIISKNYDEKIIINKIKNSDVLIHLVGLESNLSILIMK